MKSRLPLIPFASLAALALFVCAAMPQMQPAAAAQSQFYGPEQALMNSANRERAALGLRTLRWDDSLARAAKFHAERMAAQNVLSHQLPGEEDFKVRALRAGARFSALAENIAVGPNAEGLHEQWMNSPPHRANLLDPEMDAVGISVVRSESGFYGVEDFSHSVAPLTFEEQEQAIANQLKVHGLRLLTGEGSSSTGPAQGTTEKAMVDDARWACSTDGRYGGKRPPSYLYRFTSSDLESLPASLLQQIRSGKYQWAAVGACKAPSHAEFAVYRLAVLLY
jgi:uncharacterized protein YkwD